MKKFVASAVTAALVLTPISTAFAENWNNTGEYGPNYMKPQPGKDNSSTRSTKTTTKTKAKYTWKDEYVTENGHTYHILYRSADGGASYTEYARVQLS